MAATNPVPATQCGRSLESFDPELARAIELEQRRQEEHIELIASENYASQRVMKAQGSVLTNKYAEGYPGKRYYGGCEYVDDAETLAIERAKALFGADYANVQPHSGSQANAAATMALLDAGETLLGMSLAEGGHLTHGTKVNFSGRLFNAVQYGIDHKTALIDYDHVQALANEHKPKLIIAGFSAYSRVIDWERFRTIADSVGAYLMVDEAHSLGVLGAHGRGLAEEAGVEADVDFVVGTFSKSLGSIGGYCVSDHPELEAVRYSSRPYIFTASPSPSVIASTRKALQILAQRRELRTRLWDNARRLYRGLQDMGFVLGPEPSPIIAIHIEEREQVLRAWKGLLERGVYVNLVLPPAAPGGGALLRCSVSAAHTPEQLETVLNAFSSIRDALVAGSAG